MFTGFKPSGMEKIANRLGYSGEMTNFDNYLEQNPDKKRQMIVFQDAARKMAEGGYIGMQTGGMPMAEQNRLQGIINDQEGATELERRTAQNQLDAGMNPPPVVTPNVQMPTAPTVEIPTMPSPSLPLGFYDEKRQMSIDDGKSSPPPITTDDVLDPSKGTGTTTPAYTPPPEDTSNPFTERHNKTKEKIDRGEIIKPNEGEIKIDNNFYRSPEYRQAMYDFTDPMKVHAMVMTNSPYFGMHGSSAIGILDRAYKNYAERMGIDSSVSYVDPRDDATTDATGPTALPTAPTPTGGSTTKTVPVIDQNEFLEDGETPNPNFGKQVLDEEGNPVTQEVSKDITDITADRLTAPSLPTGTAITGVGIEEKEGQFVGSDRADPVGQVFGSVAVPTTLASTTQTNLPADMVANTMEAVKAKEDVTTALDTVNAAQTNPNDPRSRITAAEQTESSVADLKAAQGKAILIDNPVQRKIQDGELVSSVANAQTAAQFTEEIQAATATPTQKATVQGQLAQLTENFDATNPPAWAAGAIRGVQAAMQRRGIGASSIAGQALIQAAMESALPIAQADASTFAQFEAQNLSNRQSRAMLAAEQRAKFIGQEFDQEFQARVLNASKISDIANQNFTAEQQVQLENSRIANTMNLQNLSNSQALVMAEASALAQLDVTSLNNRQQAAVQNAQNFLNMEMANLSNSQQVVLFKAQQRVQSILTDQAAQNAARQFNASSQNQVDQFFSNLTQQASQFNATQANAQSQYNAGQRNVLERFNAELNNQRDQFNAQNRLVIDQNNAQWRRQIATADTATTNRINELNATNLLQMSNISYNNLWQYYADTMEWAWTSAENELNRYADMAIANLNADTQSEVAKRGESTAAGSAIGSLIGTLGSAYIMSSFCWVAREVYGKGDPRWFVFRMWIKYKAPNWFKKLYGKHGESYAKFISNKPMLKYVTKKLMNMVIKNERLVSYA